MNCGNNKLIYTLGYHIKDGFGDLREEVGEFGH